MFPICKNCTLRPAVTLCLKGKLCQKCGSQCHSKYQHPVQFIRYPLSNLTDQNEPQLNKQSRRIMKSMVILTSNNIGDVPKRVSKVLSKNRLVKHGIDCQNQEKKIKGKQGKWFSPSQKNESYVENSKLIRKQGKSRKSIGVMADEISQEVFVSRYREESGELLKMKQTIQHQNKLLKIMKQKLQKERGINRQIKIDYEQKLRQIRKLRD